MRQKSAKFYGHFFPCCKRRPPSPPSLASILQKLYDQTNERLLSFGSKLRATVTDEVIFDKNVARYFGVPSSPLPQSKDWIEKMLHRHDRVAQGVKNFIQRPDWPEMRALFDKQFPQAHDLPDIRKADLIVWAVRPLTPRNAVPRACGFLLPISVKGSVVVENRKRRLQARSGKERGLRAGYGALRSFYGLAPKWSRTREKRNRMISAMAKTLAAKIAGLDRLPLPWQPADLLCGYGTNEATTVRG